MTCAEFQKVLPFIIDSGGNADEEAHLKSCPVCSDLVADLKYIAEQAKLLVPMVDPSPRVWSGIQSSLEREGLVRPSGTGRFPAPVAVLPRPSGAAGRFVALAALLLVVIGLITYQGIQKNSNMQAVGAPAAGGAPVVAALDDDDEKLLQQVSDRAPAARTVYTDSLKSVNAYIADAKQAVQSNPGDEEARRHLRSAYGQKAMLYKMALARSLR